MNYLIKIGDKDVIISKEEYEEIKEGIKNKSNLISPDIQPKPSGLMSSIGFKNKETAIKMPKISDQEVNLVIDLLNQSKKPVIVGGGGIKLSKAVDEFRG